MNKKILVALACASTMASAAATDLIDDFEDGNGVANTDKGTYTDVWFAYTDVNDKGASSYTNEKDADGDVVVFAEAAADGSKFGAGLKGIVLNKGENKWDPYVVLGLKVAGGLSGCTELTYDYMGAAHNLKATVKGDEKGALSGYNKPKAAVDGSTTWAKASIPVSTLKQEDWGKDTKKVNLVMANVVQLDWEVKKEATSDFLYIDNFVCTGYKPGSASSNEEVDVSVVTVLDDFEDGNGIANTGTKDAWYAFTDENDKGKSTYTNESDEYGTVVVIADAAADASKFGAGMTGIVLDKGENENDPYVSLGLNIAEGLGGCTAITYDYKGAGHNLKATLKGDETGALTEYNRHQYAVSGSASWSKASVKVSELAQDPTWGKTVALNMANVIQLAWEVKKEASADYLYIDNVACAGKLASATKNSIAPSRKVAGLNASINGFNLDVTVAKSSMVKVHVFDMQGQVAKTFSENVAGSRSFDLRGLAKGSYLVRVSSGSMVKTARIAIK